MKKCPSCNAQVDEKNKFCINCGAPLTEVKKEEVREEPKKEEVKVEEPKKEEIKVEVTKTPSSGEGFGTASLILGIISLVLSFTTWLFIPIFLVVITIVVGLILGIINLAKGGKKFAGLILNGISIVTGIASFVIFYIFVISLGLFSAFDYLQDYSYTTKSTTKYQANPVAGFYKCSSSSNVSADNYTSKLDLYSSKNFTWTYVNENGIVKGTYTYSDVEKDTELANTNYYKLVMTSNSITQNGKEVTGTKENTYEMGIDTSGKKKSLVMINEKTYTMYYCIES